MAASSSVLIQQARTDAGLTQRELARRAGVTAPVLSAYERGRRQPGADVLVRLLEAAGFELALSPVRRHPDPARANDTLMEVLALAEAVPHRARTSPLTYPRLGVAVR